MYDSTKPYKDRIIESIKETWNTPYVNVKDGKVYKKTFYPEYHHTDGIGTKGVYHWQQRTFENAVLDALAMNLNDLAMERSWPYAIVDHLFVPEDDHEAILDIIDYLSGECLKRDIAITGGETAIHNNMEGMELSINMLGLTKNKKINQLEAGDYLIGLESSGLHSNGFTVVRELFNEYRKDFTKPTNIYIDEILRLNKKYDIHGMMHITGGAFTKLKSILKETNAEINGTHDLIPQEIFWDIYDKGVSDEEMYKTFNNGIGFIIGVSKEEAEDLLKDIRMCEADIIGEVIQGKGKVKINSKFSPQKIEF